MQDICWVQRLSNYQRVRKRLTDAVELAATRELSDLETLFQIENQIDDLLLPWSVDLSLFHKIDNPDLIDHISQVGVEFCERLRCR